MSDKLDGKVVGWMQTLSVEQIAALRNARSPADVDALSFPPDFWISAAQRELASMSYDEILSALREREPVLHKGASVWIESVTQELERRPPAISLEMRARVDYGHGEHGWGPIIRHWMNLK